MGNVTREKAKFLIFSANSKILKKDLGNGHQISKIENLLLLHNREIMKKLLKMLS